jgi:hypothetical protein
MTPLDLPASPATSWRRAATSLALDVTVPAVDILPGADVSRLRLAFGAVIEEQSGTISYWALRHPQGEPDFHHPDGFAIEVADPGAAVFRGAETT